MTPQELEYLRQQYGGGGSLPPAASLEEEPTTAPYDPRFERPSLPPPPMAPPNVPHQAMDFYPGTVTPGQLGNPPSTIGAQVETPGGNAGGPGTFNDQFPLPRGGYPDIWDQPQTIGGNLPPSPDFTPSDRYLPNDYGPATVMQPPPANYDFTGGPNLYGSAPVTPFGPTGQGTYDFSGGPNLYAGSPTVPMVGEMPSGGYNPPTNEGMFPAYAGNATYNDSGEPMGVSQQYFNYEDSPPIADTGFGGGQSLTEGEPDFGGFPVGGGDTGGYGNTGGVALTEGDPDFGGMPISDAGYTPTSEDIAAFNQDPLGGSGWPYYINEFGGGEAPPADTSGGGGGGGVGMTGAQASGGVPYGSPGPGIGGPNQAGPWVEHNPAPWYPGRPDITHSAGGNVYGAPPQGGFHPGQLIKDAAGNVIDSTGKIVMTAAQALGKLPGQISDALGRFGNNIMNDPRNTTPDYLASLGYHEMGTADNPRESLPGGVTGALPGVADIGIYGAIPGGSYFHGGASAGTRHAAGPLPGASLAGAGSGSYANVAALAGWRNRQALIANRIRQSMMAGTYKSPAGSPPVYKYPSPVLEQAGIGLARSLGYVPVQGYPGAYAPPGATAVNWSNVGQNWRNFYAAGGAGGKEFVGGNPARAGGGPHAHTPIPAST